MLDYVWPVTATLILFAGSFGGWVLAFWFMVGWVEDNESIWLPLVTATIAFICTVILISWYMSGVAAQSTY